MIEDLELRTLFRAESEEHLQTLEQGLLQLEAEPNGPSVLEYLFRSAHSLKGAARMLGVTGLETLAHHFEDELGAARRGRKSITPEVVDRLYHGLDAMRRIALEASDGTPCEVDITTVLAQLRGAPVPKVPLQANDPVISDLTISTAPATNETAVAQNVLELDTPKIAEQLQPKTDEKTAPDSLSELASMGLIVPALPATFSKLDEAPLPAPGTPFRIETIRVEPRRLDVITTLAGEVAVTTSRAVRAMTVIDELIELHDDWTRETSPSIHTAHTAFDRVRPGNGQDAGRIDQREANRLKQLGILLTQVERVRDEEMGRLALMAEEMIGAIRSIRLLPFSTIFDLFPRLVRELSREQGKEVRLEIDGGEITADKHVLEEMKDPLMHLMRNAIDHGIERPEERISAGKVREATIRLSARRTGSRLIIEVSDDGRGLDKESIARTALQKHLLTEAEVLTLSEEGIQRLILSAGFSTTPLISDVSGRGVGLDVVKTNVERIKGSIAIESQKGNGSKFRISAPMTLATTRVLLVRLGDRSFAVPIEAIESTFLAPQQSVFPIEGRTAIMWKGQPLWVALLSKLLELPRESDRGWTVNEEQRSNTTDRPGIIIDLHSTRAALFVDALVDEQEVIVKPFGGLLKRVRNVVGSTILSTGEICMVLNTQDLLTSIHKHNNHEPVDTIPKDPVKRSLLFAEDSITTRTQIRRILESAGYEVETAVDGAEAFQKLSSRAFDAVISDIEMPNMTGLQLAERIRQDPKYRELPVLLVTSLATDEDRQRGIDVGANAYITKGTFDQKMLLDTLRRLL